MTPGAGPAPDGILDGVDGVLAAHPLISAVPFFVPAFVVVAVFAAIVWRDRHRGDTENAEGPEDPEGPGSTAA